MSDPSRRVRGYSGGYSRLPVEALRLVNPAASRSLARTTRPATPNQAIEINSDEEGESSLLDFDFNSATSKPAAMAATTSDTKSTETENHTSLSLKRKLNEYLQSSETVQIFVGPKLEKWTLNEELLCDRIPYFKAAFKNGFKESKDNKLELPEDNPEAFGHLVDWLYMEKVTCTECDDLCNLLSKDETENPNHVLPWVQLWVLADKLGCEKLMRLTYVRFIGCMRRVKFGVSPEVISFLFEETPETSLLRGYFVRIFVGLFFQSGSYPSTFGEAAAASKTFNAEFLRLIKDHIGEKQESCRIIDCILHKNGDKSS